MDYNLSGKEPTSALHILAHLFLRMGFLDKAERTYKTIIAISPVEQIQPRLYLALAYIALEKKASREALNFLHLAMKDMVINSKNAVVYLLRAKALNMEGRMDEAKGAIDQYSYYIASDNNI